VTIAGCGHTKREPEIFEYCLEQLATPREYTWVVEDALHALQTACAAGFLTIAVYEETFASDQDELADLADVYLSDIREWHW
jgi:beta-phosphoglucomutase-like phosphatase (HAD superfamily)